jgi:DNA (cytosine-5)-methyltransferase 1
MIAYCIGSYHSNAWKSDNPHSGVYVSETAKTLDSTNCGMPCCNQGGVCVVEMEYDDDDNPKRSGGGQ